MRQEGFTYVEILVSLFLLLAALLCLGRANMTSLHLVGKGKINQKATLLLLEKIEQLRTAGIVDLREGDFEEEAGLYRIDWRIKDNTPYFGTKQVLCRVSYTPASTVIAESIFYRSE